VEIEKVEVQSLILGILALITLAILILMLEKFPSNSIYFKFQIQNLKNQNESM